MLMIGDAFTWTTRLVFGFIGASVCCILMPFLACLPYGTNYWVCFITCFPFGLFSGIAQGSIFTMAANMPFKYMGAVMFGNGLAALFCNGLRCITLIAFPYSNKDPSTMHNAYVGAVVFCAVCSGMMFSCVFV